MSDGKAKEMCTERHDGGRTDDGAEGLKGEAFSGDKTGGEDSVLVCVQARTGGRLTYANILIVQFCRGIAVVAQLA